MLKIIIGYGSFRDDVQFLLQKQDYLNNPVWKIAFYIHVFSAIIALFAGFSQFSHDFLINHRKLHRFFGKIYVWNILFVNVPAALILAIYANGGLLGKTAFLLLDALWCYFTYQALAAARQKDFSSHKKFMIRSYALTFSAITLRSWHMILSYAFVLGPADLYIMEAWLVFLPNLLVAEIIIRKRSSSD